eukprot:5191430-Pleurochrysis_carterae.AAC.1
MRGIGSICSVKHSRSITHAWDRFELFRQTLELNHACVPCRLAHAAATPHVPRTYRAERARRTSEQSTCAHRMHVIHARDPHTPRATQLSARAMRPYAVRTLHARCTNMFICILATRSRRTVRRQTWMSIEALPQSSSITRARAAQVVDTTPHNEQIQFESMRVVLDVPGGADELVRLPN